MLHALGFDANLVVYSTCSIHEEENELVVQRLLENEEVKGKWELCGRDEVLPKWERRGLGDMQGCVRVENTVDGGIGFFAACFKHVFNNVVNNIGGLVFTAQIRSNNIIK
ncbi:hypothetical protein FF38_09739 [Lucilia cuprina]|uniref:SAM-dependent MTase RsmB/NOP-type domain-containing protein n=1 Tax=Lucilia cuprina TaxID=7375 RepID=A0A0L0CDE9_LUCCU|nr:hypothetical protein FF38_09739 [Lucilia cuprina]